MIEIGLFDISVSRLSIPSWLLPHLDLLVKKLLIYIKKIPISDLRGFAKIIENDIADF